MTIPRIDRMTEAPIKGGWYMVPTVRGEWLCDEPDDWPVIGPLHYDKEFFKFPWKHYHIDGRFLTQGQRQRAAHYRFYQGSYREKLARACLAYPMSITERSNRAGFDKPVLMKKKCWEPALGTWPGLAESAAWQVMARAFVGHQCNRGKRGFVCPHQNVSLGGIAAVNGVITCPLHGLRIDAESGRVLGQ